MKVSNKIEMIRNTLVNSVHRGAGEVLTVGEDLPADAALLLVHMGKAKEVVEKKVESKPDSEKMAGPNPKNRDDDVESKIVKRDGGKKVKK